jgi:hypothetical protein
VRARRGGHGRCISIVLLGQLESAPAADAPDDGRDWPMLARDVFAPAQRLAEVEFPVRRAWLRYFHFDGLMPSVQPVVVGERIYFGTLSGKFFCVDAASGVDLWTTELGAPVFHTACVAPEGVVAVGTGDGRVVGLDAADGRILWEHQTGAPLWNAPLPWSGRIYIGGRDGRFYCLDAKTGAPQWTFDAGAPIAQSPALDPRRGQVYFTAEDMVLHALDAATGEPRWRSPKLRGVTARSFHPVIAPDGSVMTTTIPYYSWDRCHKLLEDVLAELLGTETLDRPATNHPGTYTKYPQWRHTRETNQRFEEHVRSIFLKARLVWARGISDAPCGRTGPGRPVSLPVRSGHRTAEVRPAGHVHGLRQEPVHPAGRRARRPGDYSSGGRCCRAPSTPTSAK